MNKKMIYAGIPVVALLFVIILPLLSASALGVSVNVKLFDLFGNDMLGDVVKNPILALVFIAVPLAVAYCAYTDKYMKYAPYALILPFIWLLIWKGGMEGGEFLSIGAGIWIYLILTVAEIVLVLKPDLLDNLAKKEEK